MYSSARIKYVCYLCFSRPWARLYRIHSRNLFYGAAAFLTVIYWAKQFWCKGRFTETFTFKLKCDENHPTDTIYSVHLVAYFYKHDLMSGHRTKKNAVYNCYVAHKNLNRVVYMGQIMSLCRGPHILIKWISCVHVKFIFQVKWNIKILDFPLFTIKWEMKGMWAILFTKCGYIIVVEYKSLQKCSFHLQFVL